MNPDTVAKPSTNYTHKKISDRLEQATIIERVRKIEEGLKEMEREY